MEFKEVIETRYSCRQYSDYRPTRAELEDILEAARLAPSAKNQQPWHFTVVTDADPEARQAVLEAYGREWLQSANTFIIVSGNASEAWVRPYDEHCHVDIDVAITTEHVCLAATAAGLSTCWICNFDPEMLMSAIQFPAGYRPAVIIPVGKAVEGSPIPKKVRKSLDEIVTWR